MIKKAARPKVGPGGIKAVTASLGLGEKRGRQAKDVPQLRGVRHVKEGFVAIVIVGIGTTSVPGRGHAASP